MGCSWKPEAIVYTYVDIRQKSCRTHEEAVDLVNAALGVNIAEIVLFGIYTTEVERLFQYCFEMCTDIVQLGHKEQAYSYILSIVSQFKSGQNLPAQLN